MKIAVIGASGSVGSRITNELLNRGHSVTAVVRHPEKIQINDRLTAVKADLNDEEKLAASLRGHDAVIHSVRFLDSDEHKIVKAVKSANVMRLLVVGGAGSLEVSPGLILVDTLEFPELYKAEARAGKVFLDEIRQETGIDWTFLCPGAILAPGERTGKFRLGDDTLLVAADGTSRISMEDLAVAMADELERPNHSRKRFTAAY